MADDESFRKLFKFEASFCELLSMPSDHYFRETDIGKRRSRTLANGDSG